MCSSMPRPARVEEDRPRQRDQVGIASTDNGFGLLKLGDEPDTVLDCDTFNRKCVPRKNSGCNWQEHQSGSEVR